MIPLQFLTWWYTQGWRQVVTNLAQRSRTVAAAFSIGSLLRTMFAPWRRIISYPGTSLGDHFHSWLDNLVSRIIGFLVRFFVLIGAGLTLVAITLFSLVELVLWPCIPVIAVAAIIKGLLS
jgi:hypothetical protein